ncbi:MAG: single-stranded DNA-binding protein [Christensenella sp.]
MNKAILVGNLTKDPERRTTSSDVSVTSFTIAVSRRYKDASGNYPADFISCVAWRQTAEFIAKYFVKGSRIGVVGSIQTRNYDDKNGVKRYVTEVNVDEAEFVGSKAQNAGGARENAPAGGAGAPQQNADDMFAEELADFQPMDDAELPF